MENKDLLVAIRTAIDCVKFYPKEQTQVKHPDGYFLLKEKQDDVLELLEHQLKSLLIINSKPNEYDINNKEIILIDKEKIHETLIENCTSFKVLEDNKVVRSCIEILKYREQQKQLKLTEEVADDEFIGLDKSQQ